MNTKIHDLREKLRGIKLIDGFNDTLISGFKIIRASKPFDQAQSVAKPALCVVIQGSKDVIVGDKIFSYTPGEYIFSSVEVPVTGRIIRASGENPYLCFMIEIEPTLVYEVLKMNPQINTTPKIEKSGTFVNKTDPRIYEALLRMVELLDRPSDINFLSPMIIKEIIFRLLNDPFGEIVGQMGIAGSQTQKITKAVGFIKTHFNKSLSVKDLAQEVGMSPSSFHKYFKEITNMSPLQYQKLIRLHEARSLLLADASDVASIGFEVGYESPSQFSREYSRLFGKSPKKDMKNSRLL